MHDTSADDAANPERRPDDVERTGLHPAVLATVIALPVALTVGVVVAAVMASRTPVLEPVALGTVPAPAAESADCGRLLSILPNDLDDFARAPLVDPAPAGAAAWQAEAVEPVVLRCGLDRPVEFDQAARLDVVNGVQWFQVDGAEQGLEASTWYAVDRTVYIALTVPDGVGPTPLQAISDAIVETLPETALDPAPIN